MFYCVSPSTVGDRYWLAFDNLITSVIRAYPDQNQLKSHLKRFGHVKLLICAMTRAYYPYRNISDILIMYPR
jgi:hypothetical protein